MVLHLFCGKDEMSQILLQADPSLIRQIVSIDTDPNAFCKTQDERYQTYSMDVNDWIDYQLSLPPDERLPPDVLICDQPCTYLGMAAYNKGSSKDDWLGSTERNDGEVAGKVRDAIRLALNVLQYMKQLKFANSGLRIMAENPRNTMLDSLWEGEYRAKAGNTLGLHDPFDCRYDHCKLCGSEYQKPSCVHTNMEALVRRLQGRTYVCEKGQVCYRMREGGPGHVQLHGQSLKEAQVYPTMVAALFAGAVIEQIGEDMVERAG